MKKPLGLRDVSKQCRPMVDQSVCHSICCFIANQTVLFSSPEPKAQGELLPSANVRRPSSVVRRASSTIASNDISSETARPRTLIFGM